MDANTYIQDTTGFGGLADSAGYFGASANTNDIFGQTINTDTTEFGGVQTLGTTIDTNTYYGDTNFTQGITTDCKCFVWSYTRND